MPKIVDFDAYRRYFNDPDLWNKIKKVAKKAGIKLTYFALVLYYALISPDTPVKYKAVIAGALGYLILPFDIVPDLIPFAGLADDWAALVAAVTYVATSISPEIKQRARDKAQEWFGPGRDSQLENLL